MYLYITVAVVTILLASFVTGKEQLHTAGTAGAEGRQLMGGAKHPLSREQCFSMLCLAAVFLILFDFTAPATCICPPKSNSFSVKEVLPASG